MSELLSISFPSTTKKRPSAPSSTACWPLTCRWRARFSSSTMGRPMARAGCSMRCHRDDQLRIVHAAATAARASRFEPGSSRRAGPSSPSRMPTSNSIPRSSPCWFSPSSRAKLPWCTDRAFCAGLRGAPWLTVAANRFLTRLTNVLYGSQSDRHGNLLQGHAHRGGARATTSKRTASTSSRRSPPNFCAPDTGLSSCRCDSSLEAGHRVRRLAGAMASGPFSSSPDIAFADVAALAGDLGCDWGGRRSGGIRRRPGHVGGRRLGLLVLWVDGRRRLRTANCSPSNLWRSRRPGPTRPEPLHQPVSSRRPSAPARRRRCVRQASRSSSRCSTGWPDHRPSFSYSALPEACSSG